MYLKEAGLTNFQKGNNWFIDLICEREFLLVLVFLKTRQCYIYVSLLIRKKDSHYSNYNIPLFVDLQIIMVK